MSEKKEIERQNEAARKAQQAEIAERERIAKYEDDQYRRGKESGDHIRYSR